MADFLEAVNQINAMVPIQKVVDALDLEVKRDAVSYQVYQCIFGHSDTTPSLHISPEKNFFNCLACSRKGSTYKFVKEYLTFILGKPAKFNQVITWLTELEPEVALIKVVNSREIIIDGDKKSRFKVDLIGGANDPILKPELLTSEEKRLYITGVMKGFDNETLVEFVKLGVSRTAIGEDLLSALIGELS